MHIFAEPVIYVATVYYITDSNIKAVMHQPNNHQVNLSPVVQSSIPIQ